MKPSLRRINRKNAFTLVELLVALALSGMVLTLIGTLAVDLVSSNRLLEQRRVDTRRQDYPFRLFRDDLCQQILDEPLQVYLNANHHPCIAIFSRIAMPGDSLHTSRIPAWVIHRPRPNTLHPERWDWIREIHPAIRGVSQSETILAADLLAWDIEILEENVWRSVDTQDKDRSMPFSIIRVLCQWSDGTCETRTYDLFDGDNRSDPE